MKMRRTKKLKKSTKQNQQPKALTEMSKKETKNKINHSKPQNKNKAKKCKTL